MAWLAARMPRWVTPDLLTAIGVLGATVTCVGYAFAGAHPALLWIATFGLVINWFGDSLDGTVARFRHIERPRYGYFLDNSLDCLAALLLALGLGLSGYVRFDFGFFTLAAYMMMSALTFLRANVTGVFYVTYGGIGPTEIRIACIVVNICLYAFPPTSFELFGVALKYPDLISIVWGLAMIVSFVICATLQVRQLALEEPAHQYLGQGLGEPKARLDNGGVPRG